MFVNRPEQPLADPAEAVGSICTHDSPFLKVSSFVVFRGAFLWKNPRGNLLLFTQQINARSLGIMIHQKIHESTLGKEF